MVKLEKDLKEAILYMPQKEKDRLLLRLIAKDSHLVDQLHFKLLEGEEATQERKEDVKEYIHHKASNYPKHYYSPGYLMMEMRDCSGLINEYRSITKDKIGEIELQLAMLSLLIRPNLKKLANAPSRKKMKFTPYVVRRAGKIISLIDKLHEDYRIEFADDLKQLGKFIKQIDPDGQVAKENGINLQLLYDH